MVENQEAVEVLQEALLKAQQRISELETAMQNGAPLSSLKPVPGLPMPPESVQKAILEQLVPETQLTAEDMRQECLEAVEKECNNFSSQHPEAHRAVAYVAGEIKRRIESLGG